MKNFKNAVVLLAMFSLAILFVAGEGSPAVADGTTSLTDIINAKDASGGTVAISEGEMTVNWTNDQDADTQYANSNTGTVSTTVDTGFDMNSLVDPVNQNIGAGDTAVYSLKVENKGNNANNVPFNFNLTVDSGVQSKFTWELFHEDGDSGGGDSTNQFDTGFETAISDTTQDVMFSENEVDTLYVVVTAHDDASNGDTLGNKVFATDNAPYGNGDAGLSGDQWENGAPISVVDSNDTQERFFQTTIIGPNLKITKSFSLVSGEARPGDTVTYTITVWNSGADTGHNVDVVDAIPQETTYVAGSANFSNTGGNPTSGIDYDDNYDGSDGFGGTDSTSAKRLRFNIDSIDDDFDDDDSATAGERDTVEVQFQVTIN